MMQISANAADDLSGLTLWALQRAATFFGCSTDHVLRLGRKGKLRLWDLGNGARPVLRVAKEDCVKLLQERLVGQREVVKQVRRRTLGGSKYVEQRRQRQQRLWTRGDDDRRN